MNICCRCGLYIGFILFGTFFIFFVFHVSKKKILQQENHKNSLVLENRLQKEYNRISYLYSNEVIQLDHNILEKNDSIKRLFFVISSLSCSVCLNDFFQQVVNLQDSLNDECCGILVMNASREVVYRYKRVYGIRIPIYINNDSILNEITNKVNIPFAFILDEKRRIRHLYLEKNRQNFKEYLKIMCNRYF